MMLTLLHTNDFHNHFTDAQAQHVRQVKAEREAAGDNVLLLDAGDAVSAGNVGVRLSGEPILERMSAAGYDAMTLGNREFHVADTLLRRKIDRAVFPVLCANIRWREDKGETLPVQPFLTKTYRDGLRVGVFGLTVPMVTPRMTARLVSAFVFDPPLEAARRQIAALRSDVDILVALTHIGLRSDEILAEACPEIDVIVGGHSHAVLPEPKVVGSVPIVQAGWFGHHLGETRLTALGAGAEKQFQVSGNLTDL